MDLVRHIIGEHRTFTYLGLTPTMCNFYIMSAVVASLSLISLFAATSFPAVLGSVGTTPQSHVPHGQDVWVSLLRLQAYHNMFTDLSVTLVTIATVSVPTDPCLASAEAKVPRMRTQDC
jgi:hypothetical protein